MFDVNKNKCLYQMDILKLPEVIVLHIYHYIPIKTLSLTCKNYWESNYKKIMSKSYNSYCRFLLRNDMNYVFINYFKINLDIIMNPHKISYKNNFFGSYYDMIKYISLHEYNSQRCLKTMNDYIKKNSIHKKKYKKMRTRFNKWSN